MVNIIDISNLINQESSKITSVFFNRDEAKEFLNIFENTRVKLDQMWIHLTDQMSIFEEVDEELIETMFYDEDPIKRSKARSDMVKDFLGEHNKGQKYTTRRVSVLFGEDGRKKPYEMKLSYYHSALTQGKGVVGLHFTYKTFENGKVTHIMPWQFYVKNPERPQTKKRKEVEDDKELVEKEMEELRQMKEEWKEDWISIGVPTKKLEKELVEKLFETYPHFRILNEELKKNKK